MLDKELLGKFKRFKKSAELLYKDGDLTGATVMYFKALFAFLDREILLKRGISPKSHTQRFRMLKKDFSENYKILDDVFYIYISTYSVSISKNLCMEVKKIVEKYDKKL